jgi:hypothetical protein
MKNIFGLLIVIVLVAGCTTLDDFAAMSPQQRAQNVCPNQQDFKVITRQASSLREEIRVAEEIIARGYAIHQQCQEIRVQIPSGVPNRTECTRFGSSVVCEERIAPPITRSETRCTETPVVISIAEERIKLEDLKRRLADSEGQREATFDECYDRVITLSAEEAFRLR